MKTRINYQEKIYETIKNIHSCDCFEFAVFEINSCNNDYLNWIDKETIKKSRWVMEIIIDEGNIKGEQELETNEKVRALILTDNNEILIANYGGVILLPGGSVDKGEIKDNSIVRELKEETGIDYELSELNYFLTVHYYQKDYPKRNGTNSNRKITTHYYLANYKGVQKQNLTAKERKDNFNLELISIENLIQRLYNHNSDNPRSKFFHKELMHVLNNYLNSSSKKLIKTK